MTVSNRLNQLVELAGNISNAFTIALYKADGDLLQRGIASTISSILPSPKYIFKFSETIYIVILVDQKWSEAQPFKIKLEKILNNTPLFVEGEPMQICAELGMSCFPDNGKTISQLIGASLHETTSEFFSKITTTL